LGRVDIVVSNAAQGGRTAPIHELDDESWFGEIATTLHGAYHVCRAVIPSMIEHRFGRIILMSSSAALRGTKGRGAGYAAAKAALHGMAKQLAVEQGPHGITANVVAPSQIDTPRVRRGGRRTDASLSAYAPT